MSRSSLWFWLLAFAVSSAGGCAPFRGESMATRPLERADRPILPHADAAYPSFQPTGHSTPGVKETIEAPAPVQTTSATQPSKWPQHVNPPPPAPEAAHEFVALAKAPEPVPPPTLIAATTVAPREPLVLALECVLENRHQDALKHLHDYDARTQEFLLRILPTLSLFAKKRLESFSSAEVAALDEQLTSMHGWVRERCDLAITRIAFCEWIKGFAVYQPLPEHHEFLAGSGQRPGELVQLYVEMKNLTSVSRQGLFETGLNCRVEIFDEAGQQCWVHHFRPEDLKLSSRLRLNEYYHNFSFFLPTLRPGAYRLAVTMTDMTNPQAPRTATNSAPLRVK